MLLARHPLFSGGSSVRVRCGCGPVACSLHPGDPPEPLSPLSEAVGPLLGRTDVADSARRRNLHLESLRSASCCLHVDVARNPKLLHSPTRLAHGVLTLPPTPPLKCGEPFEYVVPLSGAGAAQSVVEQSQGVAPPGPALALRGTARCSTVTMLRVVPGKFESVSTVQMPGGEVRRGLPATSPRPPRGLPRGLHAASPRPSQGLPLKEWQDRRPTPPPHQVLLVSADLSQNVALLKEATHQVMRTEGDGFPLFAVKVVHARDGCAATASSALYTAASTSTATTTST